jgi:hypothetical protein
VLCLQAVDLPVKIQVFIVVAMHALFHRAIFRYVDGASRLLTL